MTGDSTTTRPARSIRILTGPTASGKSAVALHICRALNAELLSIDSMKLYRRLNIGTAKPDVKIRAEIKHHLIDIKEPWESCTVKEFQAKAEAVIDNTIQAGVPLIGEGGTPLYLKVLCEGLFNGPGCDVEIRKRLEAEGGAIGIPAMHARLAAIDPKAAAKILTGDLRRIVRALEVFELTGYPISHFQSQWGVPRPDMDVRLVCLRITRETLYHRIDSRVQNMLDAGWVDECRELLSLENPLSRESLQALGYRTLFSHLREGMPLDDARRQICFDTHNFARKQINWLKRLPKTRFVDIDGDESVETVAARVMNEWNNWDSTNA